MVRLARTASHPASPFASRPASNFRCRSLSSLQSLPILSAGPIDALRAGGAVSFKETALAPHPIEAVQARQVANEWETGLRLAAMAHGQAAALEKRLDRAALAQIRRLPGGPASSHALLDAFLGRDTSVGVEDYLNRAWGRPMGAMGRRARALAILRLTVFLQSPHPATPPRAEPELRSAIPRAATSDLIEPK